MGRTDPPLSSKGTFLSNWSAETFPSLSPWEEYLELSLNFFKSKSKEIRRKIIKFDHKYGSQVFDDPVNGSYTIDGFEAFWNDIESTEENYKKVLPLVLIGAYSEFESILKRLCKDLLSYKVKFKSYNGTFISDSKIYLENEKWKVPFTDSLLSMWNKIEAYKELRNFLTHNSNVEIIKKRTDENLNKYQDYESLKQTISSVNPQELRDKLQLWIRIRENLESVSQIDICEIKIDTNDFVLPHPHPEMSEWEFYHFHYSVSLTGRTPIIKFINLGNRFLQELIIEIASKIKQ